MNGTILVGIDPGITGALAVWREGQVSSVVDLPVSGGMIDPAILARMIEDLAPVTRCYVELQGIRPGTAAGAGGKSMRGFGRIEGVLAALGVPIELVSPAAWKRAIGGLTVPACTPGTSTAVKLRLAKELARARASQLMPWLAGSWPQKKDHGRAEAALIAHYGGNIVLDRRDLRDVA